MYIVLVMYRVPAGIWTCYNWPLPTCCETFAEAKTRATTLAQSYKSPCYKTVIAEITHQLSVPEVPVELAKFSAS